MIKDTLRDNLTRLMLHHDYVRPNGQPHQTKLAKDTGVDQKTIGNYLSVEWKGSPNIETLERLCPALEVSVWQLLMPNLPVGLRSLNVLYGGLDQQMLDLCATLKQLPADTRQYIVELAEFHAAKQARPKSPETGWRS